MAAAMLMAGPIVTTAMVEDWADTGQSPSDAWAHPSGLPLRMGGPRDGDRHIEWLGPWSLQ